MNRYIHLIPTVLPLKKEFSKNYLNIFRKSAWSSVLFVVNIVGLIILHFPALYYSPLLLIKVNLAIIITSFILTYIKKDYRNIENASVTLIEHTYHINALSISKDNKLLASCSGDNSVVLWNLQNKRLLKLFEHSAWVGNVVISLKNNCIFTVSGKTENLQQWDLTTYSKIDNRKTDNKGSRGLAISEDETILVTSDLGGYIRIFDTNSINGECREKQLSNSELRKVALTKDNKNIFAGDVQGILYK
jgi:WD40 repeat protein